MIKREDLENYLNKVLTPEAFQDYGPNGLQIEGKEEISRVAFAVSATKFSINRAIENRADCLICHHGLFWKFHGTRTLTGPFAKRVLPLVRNNINLFGYHLPLDAHIEIGNAASIAKNIGLLDLEPFGDYKKCPTGVKGRFETPIKASKLQEKIATVLNHQVIHAQAEDELVSTMGIITGGANGDWYLAMKDGLDAYLTGEMSEHDWHESSEAGVHMFAGGHNATESLGIQALMNKIQKDLNLDCFYIESENPA